MCSFFPSNIKVALLHKIVQRTVVKLSFKDNTYGQQAVHIKTPVVMKARWHVSMHQPYFLTQCVSVLQKNNIFTTFGSQISKALRKNLTASTVRVARLVLATVCALAFHPTVEIFNQKPKMSTIHPIVVDHRISENFKLLVAPEVTKVPDSELRLYMVDDDPFGWDILVRNKPCSRLKYLNQLDHLNKVLPFLNQDVNLNLNLNLDESLRNLEIPVKEQELLKDHGFSKIQGYIFQKNSKSLVMMFTSESNIMIVH